MIARYLSWMALAGKKKHFRQTGEQNRSKPAWIVSTMDITTDNIVNIAVCSITKLLTFVNF